MLIMAVHQVPSLTQERYEEVIRRLTNGKSRVESPSDLPFEGLFWFILPDSARAAFASSTYLSPKKRSPGSAKR